MKAFWAITLFYYSVCVFAITPVRPGTGNPSPRLPRTSASQYPKNATSRSSTSKPTFRTREQQLLSVFEAVISTLEGKLQRIDNLDKAVEHMMRRVESLDHKIGDNIVKTDAIMSRLGDLNTKITGDDALVREKFTRSSSLSLSNKLSALDQKVSDIDIKLVKLKNHIDNNFLPADDINAEASEKKPIHMNVAAEITRAMNNEVMSHVTKDLDQLRKTTEAIDKKLQFHVNLVSQNVGKMLNLVQDVHEAVVEQNADYTVNATSTTIPPYTKSSKIDSLVHQVKPILSVSEKMDEVWNVVVGTKSSIDDLLPKSDKLLTQTQRQERAIGQIHQDLRTKTNLIIENLDMVEKRLKKQEDDVTILSQQPVPADLLIDPTIDRLVEYNPNRYSIIEEATEQITTTRVPSTTQPLTSTSTAQSTQVTPQGSLNSIINASATNQTIGSTTTKTISRKGGVIFPSVKNKPSKINTTFISESTGIKDIKGYSCTELMNAGMRQSGVYYLQIRGTTYWFLKVFCEQEIADGGWTVIQRRDDFGEPRENFNRDWADYKNGFGDPAKEFWMGNENIYMLTNNEDYALRIELEDFEGNKRYAQYSHFKIHSEADYYKLEIDGYEGNAGDSLNDPWYGSNNSPFSTYNRDNDRSSLNCASMLKGGWWWKSCGRGLNGLYLHDPQDITARQGIVWFRWRGWDYTLKKATMMIKPFVKPLNTVPLTNT
ncbi:CLUMA_CG005024, isoform A [Clunio marinus]|uniref:CLUMA_CG005024, isoform A n=1 Tax=Clunio marinus TaxID=568069 RepID=A0A1J1HTG6_9DIPT|nr:CLUMA_CG005024, isoform A [Clunio marinus]